MKTLSQKSEECSQEEAAKRFENVESQSIELGSAMELPNLNVNFADIGHFVEDPAFLYQDFSKRGVTEIPTFRVQVRSLPVLPSSEKVTLPYPFRLSIAGLLLGRPRLLISQSVVQRRWNAPRREVQNHLQSYLLYDGRKERCRHVEIPNGRLELHPVHIRHQVRLTPKGPPRVGCRLI